MLAVITVLLVVALGALLWFVRSAASRQANAASQLYERLRIEHERFLAEMRMQQATQASLERLLAEGRPSRGRSR
jgi:hypothetical protein